MRADKRCENCEWWDVNGPLYGRQHQCLRWPGDPWLWTEEDRRCWQHVKRTSETDEPIDAEVERDLRDAIRLVLEAGLETGSADTCVDLVSDVLAQVKWLRKQVVENDDLRELVPHLRLRLALARKLIEEADKPIVDWSDWAEKADSWLKVED